MKLHQILKSMWQKQNMNNKVLLCTKPRNYHDLLPTSMGQTACLNARHPPTQLILFLELASGKRPSGSPSQQFKDQLKNTLLQTEINLINWEMEEPIGEEESMIKAHPSKTRKANRRDKEKPKEEPELYIP